MINMFLIYPKMKFWKLSLMVGFMSFILMKVNINNFMSNLTNKMGCDMLSYYLMLLTIFIFSLSILSSKNILKVNYFYFFLILFLLKLLIILFMSTNLFFFYVLFEFSLIPMMMMILGWGMKVERLQASIYFFFYTLFSSLPLLYYLTFFMFMNSSNFMFFYLNMNEYLKDFFFILFFSLAFLVKMPIFLFHLWLPKAHVEAPVSGSMILAGILLKLGGYGLIRMMMMMMELMYKYSSFFISFSIWGGLIISFSCLNQLDMKMIVAFSSISHMSLLIGGLFSMNNLGLNGAIIMMIAHGLTSSGLFLLVNIFYERTHSRSLLLNKGIINISPNLSMFSFLMISSGMASPPTINLLSEFMLSFSMIYYYYGFMFILFFMLLMSVCYSMYMYSFSLHGKLFSNVFFFKKVFLLEYFLIVLHWIPTNILIMKSNMFYFI